MPLSVKYGAHLADFINSWLKVAFLWVWCAMTPRHAKMPNTWIGLQRSLQPDVKMNACPAPTPCKYPNAAGVWKLGTSVSAGPCASDFLLLALYLDSTPPPIVTEDEDD